MRVIAVLAVLAGGQVLPPQSPPPTIGTGAISGRVIDGSTGHPIDGAIVILSTHPRGATNAVVLRVATDANGRFVVTRLPAAPAYYLHAMQFGYFEGGYGRDLPATLEGRPIPLADAEWFNDAVIRLWRPGSIGGRIIDEAGEPVVGALVRVLPQVMVGGVARIAAGPVVRTDDRGAYRIGGLAAGKYVVSFPSVQSAVPASTPAAAIAGMPPERFAEAERGGWAPAPAQVMPVGRDTLLIVGPYPALPIPREGRAQVYPPTFYPAARTIPDAQMIEIAYGEERGGVDLQLRPVPTARVSGRVVGPSMLVRLLPRGSEDLGLGSEAATALSGPNGAFTMVHVPYGEYTLTTAQTTAQYHYAPGGSNLHTDLPSPPAFSPGWSGAGNIPGATPGVGYTYRNASTDLSHSGRIALVVDAPEIRDVVLELKPGVAIRGRIVVESGSIQAPMGAGPGAAAMQQSTTQPIHAEPADGALQLGMLNGLLDRQRGTFEILGLRPGLYRLRMPGVPMVKSIVWEGRDLTYEPFDATQGRDVSDVVITVTDRASTIEGAVRDQGGNLVTTAAVLAFPIDRARWTRFGFSPAHLQWVSTDSRGAYKITLPGGEYYVVAVAPHRAGGLYDPVFLSQVSSGATPVRVGWGETASHTATLRVIK
jgi:hypothetical protein